MKSRSSHLIMMLNDAFRKQQEKVVSFPSVRVILSGRLGRTIEVYGDWLPRQIFGQLTAFCAILRMISLAIAAAITNFCPDVIVLDGVSAPIPLLKVITNFGPSHHLPLVRLLAFQCFSIATTPTRSPTSVTCSHSGSFSVSIESLP
jgi:hypothetical protein